MINPYTRDNPDNFANDSARASEAGKKSTKKGRTTAERYLEEARAQGRKQSD